MHEEQELPNSVLQGCLHGAAVLHGTTGQARKQAAPAQHQIHGHVAQLGARLLQGRLRGSRHDGTSRDASTKAAGRCQAPAFQEALGCIGLRTL